MSEEKNSEDCSSIEKPPTNGGLTPEQIQQFTDDGFLIIQNLLPREAVQPLIEEMEQRVDEATNEAVRRGLLNPANTFEDAPFETRLVLVSNACSDRKWIWEEYFCDQKRITAGLFRLRAEPALLDVVESLVSPEILAHPQYALRTKLPDQDLTVLPWHQDLAYLTPEEAGDTLFINVWIPLVKATADNGCMQVMRGSHRWGLVPHNYRISTPGHKGNRGIADADLPSCEIVTGEVEVGDMLITMQLLVHRSIPNRSNTVRWSLDTRYCQIGLPTGRAHAPGGDLRMLHGFVARSRKHPEQIARSHHDWNALF